jgi:CNT family concentrative nucleoside transporter
MERFTGLIGIVVLLAIAFALSNNRKQINMRIIGWGLGLQTIFAIFILKTPIGGPLFGFLDKLMKEIIKY